MSKKKILTIDEIEDGVFGSDGLLKRVIDKMTAIGVSETIEKTGIRRQQIDKLKRQFRDSEKYDKPKVSTVVDLARSLGVE